MKSGRTTEYNPHYWILGQGDHGITYILCTLYCVPAYYYGIGQGGQVSVDTDTFVDSA